VSVTEVTVVVDVWGEVVVVSQGWHHSSWVWHRLSCHYNFPALPSMSHLLLSALASTHLSPEPRHAPPSVSPNCFVHYIPRGRFTVWHYRRHSSTTSVGLAYPQLIMYTTQDDTEIWILLSNHDLHKQSRQYGVQYLADRAL